MSYDRKTRQILPRGLALDKNFCNREAEQQKLLYNIQSSQATLVTSPRRYGKTSLVLNVLYHHKVPFAWVDLYAELDEQGIINAILAGIGDIIYKLEPSHKKALAAVSNFFSRMNLHFSFKETEIKVEFATPRQSSPKTLLTILKELEQTLQKKKKKIVLFLDEFQRLSEISKSTTIEGALRNIAQQTKHISFVFSGSNRHLLNGIFNDRTRPFYNLCDKLTLDRIDQKHYVPFIQHKAKQRWGKALSDEVIDLILDLTQRHPYYLNVLCNRLWYEKSVPVITDVDVSWEKYAFEEKSKIMAELDQLSTNQAKLIRAIAKYSQNTYLPVKNFYH